MTCTDYLVIISLAVPDVPLSYWLQTFLYGRKRDDGSREEPISNVCVESWDIFGD